MKYIKILVIKENGGILSIKFLDVIKLIICLLLSYSSGYAQQIIIADTSQDSLFCVMHYPYYNLGPDTYITGLHFPQRIEGRYCSIDTIYKRINNKLIDMYHDKIEKGYYLIMPIMVDSLGKVRGAIIERGQKDEIALKAFSLFKKEEYIPAYLRGPKTSWITFVFRDISTRWK